MLRSNYDLQAIWQATLIWFSIAWSSYFVFKRLILLQVFQAQLQQQHDISSRAGAAVQHDSNSVDSDGEDVEGDEDGDNVGGDDDDEGDEDGDADDDDDDDGRGEDGQDGE